MWKRKEELREQGHSETDTSRIVEETRTRLENEEVPPTLKGIRKVLSEPATKAKTANLKVVDTALEPLVKYGDEAKEEKTYTVQTWKRGADHPSNQNETHFA